MIPAITKKEIVGMILTVLFLILLLTLFGCSTSSEMGCANKFGYEKDKCLEDVKYKQNRWNRPYIGPDRSSR